MEEIKFRGKKVDNDEWVYGNLVHSTDAIDNYEYLIIPINNSDMYTDEKDLGFEQWYKVIPETIGQFTGLYDKTDREIYEGDIISTDLSRPYLIVEFRNGCFVYQCHDSGTTYYDIMMPLEADPETFKYNVIIGNIYENPELLKE